MVIGYSLSLVKINVYITNDIYLAFLVGCHFVSHFTQRPGPQIGMQRTMRLL